MGRAEAVLDMDMEDVAPGDAACTCGAPALGADAAQSFAARRETA